MAGKPWKFSIRIGVVSIFIVATTLTASIAIGLQYYFGYRQALDSAKSHYLSTAEQSADFLQQQHRKARDITYSLSRHDTLITADGQVAESTLRLFSESLALNPELYAVYLGFDDGRFYELINLEASPTIREELKARREERWLLVTSEASRRQQRLRYLDSKLQVQRDSLQASQYDPRLRPWYAAADSEQLYQTPPYLFQTLKAPGATYSLRLTDHQAVLGLDITLAALNDYLRTLPVPLGTELYLYDEQGTVIASNARPLRSYLPRLEPLPLSEEEQQLVASLSPLTVSNELDWSPVDFAIAGKPSGYAIDMLSLVSQLTGLSFQYQNGYSWPELVNLYQAGNIDVLQPILRNNINAFLGLFSEPFLTLPFALASRSDSPVSHLDELAAEDGATLAIGEGWSIIPEIEQRFPAITLREYPSTLDALRAVQRGEADAAIDNAIILHFNQRQFFLDGLHIEDSDDLGLPAEMGNLHLLVKPDQQALLALLNRALAAIPESATQQLRSKWLDDNQAFSQYTGAIPYAALLRTHSTGDSALGEFDDGGKHYYQFVRPLDDSAANNSAMQFAAVADSAIITGPARDNALWAAGITTLCILVVIPFAGLFAAPIVNPMKRLEAETHKVKARQYDDVQRIPTRIVETEKLSASLFAMAQSIRDHEQRQEALMEAFIELIAQAIDEKSAHTGAHCERVPALGLMLADAACQSSDGPFRDFQLNDAQRREFRIAAWLHDCGKITTPEHIVDKGAKLEANYNRIHEIRTRFEVLWRDARIACLKAQQQDPDKTDLLNAQLDERLRELQEQFAFIAQANVGGEFLSEDDKARIRQIGEQSWTRHFDDRLGLSPLEQRRLGANQRPLPTLEKLLDDKPEHLLPHEHPPHYPEHLGIRMSVPSHRANLGELYNLLIERGTLTEEDRFKINEHIINTIRMLDTLPFPDELARVPHYASTHHERLDGQGYPRGLNAEQMEIPDRILAVADVFEALTAADRPYKDAKRLDEALAIMARMVQEGHLDAEVFALLLRSGVYLNYAHQYLASSQFAEIRIEDYLVGYPE